MRKVKWGLAAFLAVYVLFVAGLYIAQRSLVFLPDLSVPDRQAAGVPDMSAVTVRTDDGLDLNGWFIPAPEDSMKPVLVYFHGNAGSIEERGPNVRPWIDDGYGVLLAEYRGYGGNPGAPSEQGLYADAQAWLDWLVHQGISEHRILLYGESLGTGVAAEMALRHPDAQALILQSGYTSLPDVARLSYPYVPVHVLMKDRFETLQKISSVHVPVLVLHGALDEIIPLVQAQAVYEAANAPKNIVVFPKGHHNGLSPLEIKKAVESFISTLSPVRDAGQGAVRNSSE